MTNQVTIVNAERDNYEIRINDLMKELEGSEEVCSFLQNQIKEKNDSNEDLKRKMKVMDDENGRLKA